MGKTIPFPQDPTHPLRMNHPDARRFTRRIETLVETTMREFAEEGYGRKALEIETALVLGRQLLRLGTEFLSQAAGDHIDRLERALGEAEAKASLHGIAAEGSVDGSAPQPRPARVMVHGISEDHIAKLATHEIDLLIRSPGWAENVREYLRGIGYAVGDMSSAEGQIALTVVPINGGHST